MNEGVLYRAQKWGTKPDSDKEFMPDEILESMNDPDSIASHGLGTACPVDIDGTVWELSVAKIANNAWPCGAGDFLLASHDMWLAVGGFDEYPGNA